MKKKQLLTVLLLFVLLGVLCGTYFLASRYQADKEKLENEDDKETVLYEMNQKDITKIHYVNSKADLTLIKENGEWKIEGDKDFPIDQSKVENMIENAASVSATRVVSEDCSDLSEYDLDKPSLQLTVTDKDGNEKTITYGMESAAAEGCYAYTDNQKKIYVVPATVTTEFDYAKNELMELPELPEINEEYVTAYSVEKKKKTTFCAKYDKENAVFADVYGWDITKPYSQTVAGDEDGLQSVFSNVASMEFTAGVSYQADKKELKKYGLLSPNYVLNVTYYTVDSDSEEDEEDTETEVAEKDKKYHTLKLLVGAKDDLQENYYVMLEGNPGIYLLSVDTVSAMTQIDTFSCVYTSACPINMDSLQKVVVEYQNKTYSMTISREKKDSSEKDSSDTETTDYTVTLNGKEVDKDKFQTACEALGELSYSSAIQNEVKKDSVIARITLTQDNKKSVVKILNYDGVNFYRIDVDGVHQFLVEKNQVDQIIKKLVSLA